MVQRRLPRPSELRQLLRPAPFVRDADERRLRRAASIADLRTIARRRTPRAVFDYVDGAADGELSLHRARRAFARVEFTPTVLRDVSETDTSREILGQRARMPFAFAPTGFTRMMHHEGERAVASVAQQAGIPYTLSTMGTTTIEDVAAAAPQARKWFQLYLWRDRAPGKGPRAARCRGRLRHPDAHRRHTGRRRAAARRPQRAHDPARAVAAHVPGRRPASALVVQPAHHRAADVLQPRLRLRHRRGDDQPGLRPRAHHGRRRMAARRVGRASS